MLCDRQNVKCVTCILSFNPHNDPLRSILFIFHVIGRYRGTEMLFTQVPQAIRSTAGKGTSYLKLMLLIAIRLLEPVS